MMWSRYRTLGLLLVCSVSLLVSGTTAATKTTRQKRPITRLKHDPSAENVSIFDGINDKSLDVKVILSNSKKGNVFVENKTKQPLTVHLPPAVAAVQVLKQFGGGFGNQGGGAGAGGGQQGGGAGAQMGGGGMMGGGMGGGGMMGGGFFSIPPEQVAKVSYKGVCLEYGKREPSPKMTYRLARVEDKVKKPELRELLAMMKDSKIDQHVFQAAAWHLSNDMSWEELASKRVKRLGGLPPKPFFNVAHIRQAQMLVAKAREEVKKKAEEEEPKSAKDETPKRRSPRVKL